MSELNFIRRALSKKGWILVLITFCQCVTGVIGILLAFLMRNVIDSAVAHQQHSFFLWLCLFIGVCLVQVLSKSAYRYFSEMARASYENQMREFMFSQLLQMDYKQLSDHHSGQLMTLMTSDIGYVIEGLVRCVPTMFALFVKIAGLLFALTLISPLITVLFLIGGCFMILCSLTPRMKLRKLQHQVQSEESGVRSFIQECFHSILVILAFDKHDVVVSESNHRMNRLFSARMRRIGYSNRYTTLLNLMMNLAYALGLAIGGYGLMTQSMTYGTMSALIQLVSMIQSPFVEVGALLPKMNAMGTSLERLNQMCDQHHSRKEKVDQHIEAIVFDGVYFHYDQNEDVLKDKSFEIKKGQFAGLIGKSGVGKSTMFKLMLGVLHPSSGQVYVKLSDGECVSCALLPYGKMAYVPQGNGLMSGTIEQAVAFSTTSIDSNKVRWACELACAHDFIMNTPSGYQTQLKEHGSGLSEGQMQRLAVARALYSDAEVLLLDECTSALDEQTELQLLGNLRGLKEKTVLLITHRKQALSFCDVILNGEEKE